MSVGTRRRRVYRACWQVFLALTTSAVTPYDQGVPVTFDLLTARDRDWGLDDFVAEVNRLLPEVVPGDAATRAKAEVSARLVRHYATEGVLPKPLKEGVEARYDGDHLVRVLALRRLLLEGYPSTVAGAFLQRHDRERLARFLLGELRLDLDLTPGGPPAGPASADLSADARARLAAMRARAGLPPLPDAQAPAAPPPGRRETRRVRADRSHGRRHRGAPPRRTAARRTAAAAARRARRRLDALPAAARVGAARARTASSTPPPRPPGTPCATPCWRASRRSPWSAACAAERRPQPPHPRHRREARGTDPPATRRLVVRRTPNGRPVPRAPKEPP